MSTFVERNFRVKGTIDCTYTFLDGSSMANIAGIEVQLWHQAPLQSIFLGKGITNEAGEYVIDIVISSPVTYIENGQITNVYIKAYYNGELLNSPGYDTDAQAYFDALTPQPSAMFKFAINDLVTALKTENIWSELDCLWILAAEDQQNATINLKSPSQNVIAPVSSPTFAIMEGFTGNGTSSYLNLNFNPSSGTHKFLRDSASMGIYIRSNVNEAKVDMGSDGGSYYNLILARNSGSFDVYANANTLFSASNSDSRGLFSWRRTSSTTSASYKNGVQQNTSSTSSQAITNYNIYALCRNDSGSASLFSTKQAAMIFAGSGAIDQSVLYTILQNFAIRIGFNV